MYIMISSKLKFLDERKTNSNFLLGSIGIFPLLSIKEIIPLLFEIITVKTKTKIQSEESFFISFRQFQLTNVKMMSKLRKH